MSNNNVGEDESDVVLSDFEDDDHPPPSEIKFDDVSPERFRELVAELDREKSARVLAENSKSELQVSFNRLKALAHEAIKKRDEANKEKERVGGELVEVEKVKDEVLRELEEVKREKDEVLRELEEVKRGKDEVSREMEEVVKGKEAARAEIESAARMLVTGIEKISGKVSYIKNFTVGGLPRSQKYTGLSAVVYGVIKRTNDIVEEMVKEIEVANKSRNEARETIEHRNYEIAIEVSELEASIGRLREEVAEKGSRIEELEKCVVEKDGKIGEIEGLMEEKIGEVEKERRDLRKMVDEYEGRVRELEAEMEGQKPLLGEQLSFVSKIHDQLYSVIRVVDSSNGDQSDIVESLFVLQETGLEENIRATLAGLESIFELSKIVSGKTKDVVDEKSRAVKSLNETVARLFREKEHVGVLLRSALSKRLTSNPTSKTNEVFQVAENGLREAGIEFKFGAFYEDEKVAASLSKEGNQETKDDEIYALAGALENIIKEAQLQIIELQHSVEELREESSLLKSRLESQAKELSHKKHRIEELELKEHQTNENIEGLRMDLAAAEEDITRWKGAAEQEAAAGSAIEQEYLVQISSLKQEVEEAKQTMLESVKKLKFKEETASAAMAAREAAEKSLRLADIRATRLRDRVEELTRQLENLDNRGDGRSRTRPRYACWPWEWLGIDFVGYQRQIEPTQQQNSNEMELSEPLM